MKKHNLLTEGTLYSSQIYTYKTKDGRAIFRFSYIYMGSYYQVNIHNYPSYNGRSSGSSIAHWLPTSSNGANRKICFNSGKEPKTLSDAQKISTSWAEVTWEYIKTGITIDTQVIRNSN